MIEKCKFLFLTSRPISWINTAFPFGAAYLMTGGELDAVFWIGTFYFLIPYNVILYGINDVFDYESDMKNPRKNGIEGIRLQRKFHPFVVWVSIILNIPFLVYLFANGNFASNIWLVFVMFMVVAYSAPKLRFKERPFLDSFTSATHFFGPMVFAMLLTGWSTQYWLVTVAFCAWAMASHAFGAVQDIVPDRAAKIHSIATFLGARKTVWFAIILYVLSGILILGFGWIGVPIAICAALYVWDIVPFVKLSDKKSGLANRGWKRFIWLNWITGAVVTITLIVSRI